MGVFFFLSNALLGVGLAMDAFSVSLANGLHEPEMRRRKMCLIAGVFGFFQAFMPLLGWLCVHTILVYFNAFSRFIPWIALLLLLYIGGSMLREGREAQEEEEAPGVGVSALLLQGVATSIDALSVGFTIADYDLSHAVLAALIIAAVTFLLCLVALQLGRRFGMKLAGRANLLGGWILIAIGIDIFISGVFFS